MRELLVSQEDNFCGRFGEYFSPQKHFIMKKILKSLGLVLIAVICLCAVNIESKAGATDQILSLSGGVAAILDATPRDSAEVIINEARKHNIDLSLYTDEEGESTLFMANVSKTLNVRINPNADSKRVGKLYKDCGGVVLEKGETWSLIKSGNLVGWANNDYLLFGDEAIELAEDVGVTMATVDTKSLRVRTEASTDSEVLAILPRGESLEVISKDEEWVMVDFDGQDAYVSAEYVDIDFIIDAGETLQEIKDREAEEFEAKRFIHHAQYATDEETLNFLAALIYCEAGGEPYEGQLAVGSVVMNRVRSEAYPNTIAEVIYASGQFSPVKSGKVDRVYQAKKYSQSCLNAAKEVIDGYSNVGDITHFRRADGRAGLIIGRHVFY